MKNRCALVSRWTTGCDATDQFLTSEIPKSDYQIIINVRVEDEAALRAHAKEFAAKIGMGPDLRDCESVSIEELVLWLLDDTLHLLRAKDAVVPRADGVRCVGSFIRQIPKA